MIMIAVLFFIALLVSGVATFLRRATLDGMIARNRDLVSRCESLARGGVQLGTAVLLQDRLDEEASGLRSETRRDLWARVGDVKISVADGGRLRVRIEDTGSRLNLNALLDQEGQASEPELAESFLSSFLEKVIDEMDLAEEDQRYQPGELARNLIDYVDADDVELRGDREDDYYQLQDPPYRAANRPLLSIDELGLVEGFDGALLDAIRPYATVYPFTGGGINPNTAPSHVLAVLYHGVSGDYRLTDQETVRRILEMREEAVLCDETAQNPACTPVFETGLQEAYPVPTYATDVFQVSAEASYGEVRRTIEAVIDRSDPTAPLVLSWRVR
jgi:general secretion pathway protein K